MESPGRVTDGITLKFPAKLWKLAHVCTSEAISWNPEGNAILIRQGQFEAEYLGQDSEIFKTGNFHSFIRQLNIYGFKKKSGNSKVSRLMKENKKDRVYEYQHEFFQRDRRDLLPKVERKGKRPGLKANDINTMIQLGRFSSKAINRSPKKYLVPTPLGEITHHLLDTPVEKHARSNKAKTNGELVAPCSDMQCINPHNLHRQISDVMYGIDAIDEVNNETNQQQISSEDMHMHTSLQGPDSPPSLNVSVLETPIIFLPSLSPDNSILMSEPGIEYGTSPDLLSSSSDHDQVNTIVNSSQSDGILDQSLDQVENILDCALQLYSTAVPLPSIDVENSDNKEVIKSADGLPQKSGDCQYSMGGTKFQGMFTPAYFDLNSGTVTLYLPDSAGEQPIRK